MGLISRVSSRTYRFKKKLNFCPIFFQSSRKLLQILWSRGLYVSRNDTGGKRIDSVYPGASSQKNQKFKKPRKQQKQHRFETEASFERGREFHPKPNNLAGAKTQKTQAIRQHLQFRRKQQK